MFNTSRKQVAVLGVLMVLGILWIFLATDLLSDKPVSLISDHPGVIFIDNEAPFEPLITLPLKEKSKEQADREREETYAKLIAKERIKDIEIIKRIFKEGGRSYVWGWEKEKSRINEDGFFGKICLGLYNLYGLNFVMSRVGPQDDSRQAISWEDIGVTELSAKKIHFEAATRTAGNLWKVFDQPRSERKKAAECFEGEGGWSFDDGMRVAFEINVALERAGAVLDDIGLDKEHLRVVLLKDTRDSIEDTRRLIKAEEMGASDGEGHIRSLAEEAISEWNYTASGLGLTPYEKKSLEPYKNKENVNK